MPLGCSGFVFTRGADPISNIGRRCRFHYNPLRPSGDGPRIGLPEVQQHYHADMGVARRRSAAVGPRSSFPKPRRSVAHEALRFGGQPASPSRTCPTRCARRPDVSAIKPTQTRTSPRQRAMRRWRSQMMAVPGPADRDMFEGLAGMLHQASGIDLRTQEHAAFNGI